MLCSVRIFNTFYTIRNLRLPFSNANSDPVCEIIKQLRPLSPHPPEIGLSYQKASIYRSFCQKIVKARQNACIYHYHNNFLQRWGSTSLNFQEYPLPPENKIFKGKIHL